MNRSCFPLRDVLPRLCPSLPGLHGKLRSVAFAAPTSLWRGREACSYNPLGHLATNRAGGKSLTAAARILDPKLSDRHAVDVSVFRRAVESVERDVRTWMNDIIHCPDPAQSS